MKPLCFILMPFGRKPAANGTLIDFDQVYAELVAPAVSEAELEPLRADEETVGGIIHKPMFERLVLCQYAVADLTLANANVFYELGVRHAVRPWSTVPIIAQDQRLPFDVDMLRTIHYGLTSDGRLDPARVESTRAAITKVLKEARKGHKDSPVFQLVDGLAAVEVSHEKTDVFRERVNYSNRLKQTLAAARKTGLAAVRTVERELHTIADVESGVAIDLLLSYRAICAWKEMIALVDKMAAPLQATVMVREQLGFALNRDKRREEAEKVLSALIEERGPSSETLGILGRVYKDCWQEARAAGDTVLADGYLQKAVDTYLAGFEADWRDAYPGINAVTLMELQDPPDPRRTDILPVVRYAVERKMARGKPDYWDRATLLELAVLEGCEGQARRTLSIALTCVREGWEAKTTADNLGFIRSRREQQGRQPAWATEIEQVLRKRSSQ